ncbi:hypothetical protein ABFB09_04695 [Dehalogenimonas sp. THU2]|uniref:hypothetical protein n=1 Tax=Dehalogenimonas sp. THU2 TaxID=3151121 RepID=UPI00321870FF
MIKETDTVTRICYCGQAVTVDSDARFTYSTCARCPRCGAEAFVTRYERFGTSLNQLVFKCSSCFDQFEAGIDNISLM